MGFLDEPLLLVPIHVDALAVGSQLPPDAIFQWTNLAPNFSVGNYFFGSELVGDTSGAGTPFDQAKGLDTGVHLLFGLPRAFTRGIQRDDEPLTFPAIPNRWLVQRFFGNPAAYKAWLIKSDVPAADDASGVPWPIFPEDEATAVKFGAIGDCAEVTAPLSEDDEAALIDLTVVGQGDPLFSVYYPSCHSVLGFHDAMADVPAGSSVSYLVSGWFSNSADDPLHTATWRTGNIPAEAVTDFRTRHKIQPGEPLTEAQQAALVTELRDAWLKERQWTCDFKVNPETPSRLLCHGLVRGIIWQGESWNYLQPSGAGASLGVPEIFPPNADNVETEYQVAIGNTGSEALAAGLADGAVDQDLIAALQDGLLDQPISAAELQYELHVRRFEGIHGGTTFAIHPEGNELTVDVSDLNSASSRAVILPPSLRNLLQELNQKQGECDRLSREIEDISWQVYALWYAWTFAYRLNGVAGSTSQLSAFKGALQQARANLNTAAAARDDVCTLAKDPEARTGRLIGELARYPKTNQDGSTQTDDAGKPVLQYRLVITTAPPFYKPSEPVIAISGPALARRYSAQSSGPLGCRLSSQIVSGITLHIPADGDFTVTAEGLLDQLFTGQTEFQFQAGANKSLMGEAVMLDPEQASNIAAQASQQFVGQLTTIVQALQDPKGNPPSAPNALVGILPDRIARFDWERNPWIPLVMAWSVSWGSHYQTSAGQSMPENLVTGSWRLDSTGELVSQNGVANGPQTTYQGYSLLSASASQSLAQRLENLNQSSPMVNIGRYVEERLRHVCALDPAMLKNQNAQLQKLGGFNAALNRQEVGMLIPPLDFGRWFNSSAFFVDSIRSFLNDGRAQSPRDRFGPAPDRSGNPFLPVRSGQLQITKLSIVDAFGQTLLLPVANINQSIGTRNSMLRPAHTFYAPGSNTSGAMTLPPRFTQPLRLNFKCADPQEGAQSDSATVCGWILPNHLEKSLTIYDTNGRPLGALQRKLGQVSGTEDKTAFFWVDLPGGTNGDGLPINLEERLAKIITNQQLRYFCSWVLSLDPDVGASFSSLISATTASADQRVPDEDPGVSVLVGRPLALVRARLGLEIAGLPPHQLELRAETGSLMEMIDTGGVEKVKWPVRLGDFKVRNDGLIGLFKCAPAQSADASGPFYPAWAAPDLLPSDAFASQDFAIDCVESLEVAMLMDPQARVHATTGVLPRTFFELPHESATGARRVREVFFQTAPLLGFSPTPAMPRPSDDYGEWSWAYRPDVTHWALDPNLIEATYLGGFNDAWPTVSEGWLRLAIAPVKVLSFWVREPIDSVAPKTRLHLAWSLQSAESLKLMKATEPGQKFALVESWDAAPFPNEYSVVIDTQTTYRLIASTEDGKQDSKDLTIKIGGAE